MDKFPNINKVEGSVPLSKVEEKLDDNRKEARADFENVEIAPTEDELQVIDTVSVGLRIMLEQVYKIHCKEILKDRIHIVKEGTLNKKYGRGMNQTPFGDIYLEPLSSHGSKIIFARTLTHELIHYLSFTSIKTSEKNAEVKSEPHIHGLSILKYEEAGVRDYFKVVDEAITSYLSTKFLRLGLDYAQNHPEENIAYTEECLAVDVIKEWLQGLPDSTNINKREWYNTESIPRAEEMARLIKSEASLEEKIKFYKEKIAALPQNKKDDFYMERTGEFGEMYTEISAMIATKESDPVVIKKETIAFINKIALLKLNGHNFLDVVRFIEKMLGPGSFKKLAEKFSKFEKDEEVDKK
jgi:hypothetical protein